MRPRIFFSSGRWHVYTDWAPIVGFILMKSAYAYAKAIWKRKKR